MTKKSIILILLLVLLGGLTYWAVNLKSNADRSDTELFNFAIADTTSIDRIVITEPSGLTFEAIRKGDAWTDKAGNCIIQDHIYSIMDAVKNIEFKGYVSENAKTNYVKLLSSQSKTVKFYQNGEWSKTWYLGTPTPDHYAQVMLVDSEEEGKSDLPVLMKIKGFNGFIDPRFFADPRKWQCTDIFSLAVNEIQSVQYVNFEDPGRTFSVQRDGFQFKVYQDGSELPLTDTTKVFNYLSRFKKINFELPNYVLTPFQIDSMKQTTPFAQLTVTERNDQANTLKFYRIQGPETFNNEFSEMVNYDMNKFWCELPSGEIVKCQYFVFDPLFRGDLYFPMDETRFVKKVQKANT